MFMQIVKTQAQTLAQVFQRRGAVKTIFKAYTKKEKWNGVILSQFYPAEILMSLVFFFLNLKFLFCGIGHLVPLLIAGLTFH
uniref:Uncharacterized protein n=1 Tax=Anguilla anguilla TaxID=7936 RepID=A0A0E9Q267_ANGAN